MVSISRTSSELSSASGIGIEEDTATSLPSSRFFTWYVAGDGGKKANFAAKRETMHPIPPKWWLESQLIDGESNPNACVDRKQKKGRARKKRELSGFVLKCRERRRE